MKLIKVFFILLFLIGNYSCSKNEKKVSSINAKSLDLQVLEAYKEGLKSLEEGDVLFAAKKFNEAETLFPQSIWAPKSSLMAAYAYYSQDYYEDAIIELTRFIKIYSLNENIDYAYYLLGLSYYEQIADEKKDLNSIIRAKENFEIIVREYPNTEYALDSGFKIDLINDVLASKEMYLGRYYFEKKKWVAAINRFRTVVDNYDTTIYSEEALHRLVEIYYTLGLKNESQKYAKLLGYNYQSSIWYERSYSYFNRQYKLRQNDIKNNKSLIKKFRSFFE